MENKKTLILVPDIVNGPGGISNYYRVLSSYLDNSVEYFERGKRYHKKQSKFIVLIISAWDYFRFIIKLLSFKYGQIVSSTSFDKIPVQRDLVYILISKVFNKKVIIFFRGWNQYYVDKILFKQSIIRNGLFLSDKIIVLSKSFQDQLIQAGYSKQIVTETTVVADELVANFDENKIISKANNDIVNILFLSRIEKAKGVYELVDAFDIVSKVNDKINLVLAGDGNDLLDLKRYVEQKRIKNITFKGYLKGQDKINVYLQSHVFIFLSESEGMPNAVLEAMSFGLPVISTSVGGLADILTHNVTGFVISKNDVTGIENSILALINDRNLLKSISLYNYNYAKKHFLASQVSKRLISIINK